MISLALGTALAAFTVIYGMTPPGPSDLALQALSGTPLVTVEATNNWILLRPTFQEPVTGLVFYPGGRVDHLSYLLVLLQVAEEGHLVALVRMPLNLAFLAPNRAAAVQATLPEVRCWAVGGHALGGAMAANYLYTHPDAAEGLVLWAARPAASNSLADRRGLRVLSLFAGEDGPATAEEVAASRPLLPDDAVFSAIEGGNNAGFGSYGRQPGDHFAPLPVELQWRQAARATAALLASLGGEPSGFKPDDH